MPQFRIFREAVAELLAGKQKSRAEMNGIRVADAYPQGVYSKRITGENAIFVKTPVILSAR